MTFSEEIWGENPAALLLEKIYSRVRRTGWIPPCISDRDYSCIDCPLTELDICELIRNPDVTNLILYEQERYFKEIRLIKKKMEAIFDILKTNQISFHVSVLSNIARKEYAELFFNEKNAQDFIYQYQEQWIVEEGIVKLVC